MNKENLKELFSQAAEIAESVPKELREVAFNRAVDALLGHQKTKVANRSRRASPLTGKKTANTVTDQIAILLSTLDCTKYPEIATTPRVLERALFLLRAVRDNHDIDGLGASQIAKILTEKFRLRTTRQAVTQALDAASNKVDKRITSGKSTYHLMQPGYKYLEDGNFTLSIAPRKVIQNPKQIISPSQESSGKPNKGEKRARGSGRPGPGAMLQQLVELGFFTECRSITDIQQYCEKNLAHIYTVNELSTPLRRAVHNGLLKREENADGQYEYIAQ